MSNLFYYLGDKTYPYRTIMAEHKDFKIGNTVIPKQSTIIAEQTHSKHVHLCTTADMGAGFDSHSQILDCDAMISNTPNQFLLIRTADCTPVLLYDNRNSAVGAIHSGREGTRKNIVLQTILAMHSAFGTLPSELKVWVGAGICHQHYPVNDEIWQEFKQTLNQSDIDVSKEFYPRLDIRKTINQQLYKAGVLPSNITNIDICTYESSDYFSFRRDGTNNRQINIIGLIDG
jgi:YfiH family protein